MSEAGKIVGEALTRQKQAQESAQQTAAEIDAQRERERASGVAFGKPAPSVTPEGNRK